MFKMKYKKEIKIPSIFLVTSLMVILSSVFVVAQFGVGSPGTVNVYPGGSVGTAFSLQNTLDDTSAITIEASILEGEEYASFIGGTQFDVPKGGVVPVPVRVSVPASAKIGDIYKVNALFKTVSGGAESGVAKSNGSAIVFSFNTEMSFYILVVEKPGEKPAPGEGISIGWVILAIVLVIAIIAVVWFVIKSKREK